MGRHQNGSTAGCPLRFPVLLLAFVVLAGGTALAQQNSQPSGNATDRVIYNAGWYLNGSLQIPCYWAGTRRIDLAGDGVHDARARACAVSEGTVYSAGWWNDGARDTACYWAGTSRTDLTGDEARGSQATSIAVLGDTVYTGGQWNDGNRWQPCYWQGTRRVDLDSTGSPNSGVWSIAVSGGVVYTAGWWNDGTRDIACFWTGTRRTDVDGGAKGSYANAIAVSNGLVYAAGAWDWDGKASKACYWVGKKRTNIASTGGAWAISVSKGVVSVAGYTNEQDRWIPWLWAKGARTDLGDGVHPGFVCSSSFTAGIFCPSGFCWDGTRNVACYWMETYRVDLDGGDGGSMAGAPAFFTGK